MFKQTKTTLKELSAQYRSVLKKCACLNAIVIAGVTFGANADYIGGRYIDTDTTFENEAVAEQIFTEQDNTTARSTIADGANPGYGGYAFVNRGSALTVKNSIYENNTFDGQGGIFSTRTPKEGKNAKLTIEDSQFLGNTSILEGAAIANYNIAVIKNSTFKDNKANPGEFKSDYKNTEVGGGAIALGSEATTTIANSVFQGNESGVNGGAIKTKAGTMDSAAYNDRKGIKNKNSAALLSVTESTFTGNKAKYLGGALFNTFYHGTSTTDTTGVVVSGSTFASNEAENGGAIYNDGTKDANDKGGVMTINDSTFTGNKALLSVTDDSTYKKEGVGGAIASSGVLTVNNSIFTGNTALSTGTGYGLGGALSTVTVDGLATRMDVNGSTFTENEANAGGAIYNMLKTAGLGTINVTDSTFTGNKASTGSAIANYDIMTITGSDFIGNEVVGEEDGGTLFVGSQSRTLIEGGSFKNNVSSTVGGAIATRSPQLGNQKDAKLSVEGTSFEGNTAATNGGAIYNDFYRNMTNDDGVLIKNATFVNNTAGDNGGAIFNEGTQDTGGKTAVITLAGKNIFSGNMANGKLNDIYNDGVLNISGDLTLDGGVTGNGIINFTDDTNLVARLQDKAIIDASRVSGLNNVTFTMSDLVVENGIDSIEYQLVKADTIDEQFAGIVAENVLYDFALGTQNGSVKISRKSVAEQTAGLEKAGLDSNSAKTIAAISGVKTTGNAAADALFADLTAAAQSGDTAAAEAINEVAKVINPESEAVVQSAAVSTQNIINDLAVERMDMGRNGGDLSLTSGGVWVQGLFNRAKSGDKFSANTRGISAGIDETINNDIMLGIGYAYGHSNVSAKTRDTDIDNHSVFLYGQYKPTQWYANATLNYTTSGYEENGSVAGLAVDSDYRANAFGANVATGYDFASGLTPELGLRYLHVKTNDYTNSLGFHTDAKNTNFLTGIAGLRYGFDVVASDALLLRPELSAAAKYDLVSNGNTATVALPGVDAYTLDVERLNRFGGEFGAGLTMSYYGLDLSLTYYIDVRKDYTSQTGMAKFRYNF